MFTDALEQMLEVVTYCLENKHESDAVTTFEVMDDLMELVRAHAVSNSYECGLCLCLCLYVYMYICMCVCMFLRMESVVVCCVQTTDVASDVGGGLGHVSGGSAAPLPQLHSPSRRRPSLQRRRTLPRAIRHTLHRAFVRRRAPALQTQRGRHGHGHGQRHIAQTNGRGCRDIHAQQSYTDDAMPPLTRSVQQAEGADEG